MIPVACKTHTARPTIGNQRANIVNNYDRAASAQVANENADKYAVQKMVISITAKLRNEYGAIPRVSFLTPEESAYARSGGLVLFKSHVCSVRGGYWREVVDRSSHFGPRVPTPEMVAEAERIMALPERERPTPPLLPVYEKAPKMPKLPSDVREAMSRGVERLRACTEGFQRRLGYEQGLSEAMNAIKHFLTTSQAIGSFQPGKKVYRQEVRDFLQELSSLSQDLQNRRARSIKERQTINRRFTNSDAPFRG